MLAPVTYTPRLLLLVVQVFESWLHPQKFRTMICKDGEACHREVCFFAHGAEQLRASTGGEQ
jgi:hypothetical protein